MVSRSLAPIAPRRDDLFAPLELHFDKFFEEFFNPKGLNSLKATAGFPKLNAYATADELVFVVSTSGMSAEDIDVDVTPDGFLVLSGKMGKTYQAPEFAEWYIRELRGSAFERRIKLPDIVEGDPRASMKDGILTLRWPLKSPTKETPKAKRIPITSE